MMHSMVVIWTTVLSTTGPMVSPSSGDDTYDLLCGPRCVQFLLQYYDIEEPGLQEIVRETQWPRVEAGTSLGSLKRFVESRGLHTAAVRISDVSRLSWDYPVVVHWGEATSPGAVGHFVVWLPRSTTETMYFWNGLHGVQSLDVHQFARYASGVVLLSSVAPIVEPYDCMATVPILETMLQFTAATIAILLVLEFFKPCVLYSFSRVRKSR